MSTDSKRMRAAAVAHDEALRAERLAAIEAAPRLRERARRERAGTRLLVVAAGLVALAFLGAAVWGLVSRSSGQTELDRLADARAGAAEAITLMLTADPARPDAYLDRVLEVSVGEQAQRLERARGELREAVAALAAPSTGHVLSAGGEPETGDTVPVLVVADASAPELVGGSVADPLEQNSGVHRVAVRVTMTRDGERWLVAGTERVW